MNLVNTHLDIPENNIFNFRKHQYNLLSYHINNMFTYLNKFGMNIDIDNIIIKRIEPLYYNNINESKLHHIKIFNSDESLLLEFLYPKLFDDIFFKLNGVNYIPVMYCVDQPIIFKKNTVTLYSLFLPITIELKYKSKTLINKKKYDTWLFFRIFFDKETTKNICNRFDFEYKEVENREINKLFQFKTQNKNIKKTLNMLFFDTHTENLYKEYYDMDVVDFKKILMKMFIIINDDKPSFIDLNYKRLVFSEILLMPLFNAVTFTVLNKLIKGELMNKILLNSTNALCKWFINDMYRKNPYDSYNSYSTLLSYKFTFNNKQKPKNSIITARVNLPSEISGIHESYMNIVCPISISNTNIGESNHFVPNLELKDLTFGLFDLEKSV